MTDDKKTYTIVKTERDCIKGFFETTIAQKLTLKEAVTIKQTLNEDSSRFTSYKIEEKEI